MSRVTKYDIEKLAEFENEIMEYDLTRDEQITSNNEVY